VYVVSLQLTFITTLSLFYWLSYHIIPTLAEYQL
jgi:hypothetical protein